MDKQLQFGQLDIVVIAQKHNPSILNPDFLLRNKIVQEDWGWEADTNSTLSTPQFSQVSYTCGVSIQAVMERLIFTSKSAVHFDAVCAVAVAYVNTLPHVSYTAFGINPTGHVLAASAAEAVSFLLGKVMRGEAFRSFAGGPSGGECAYIFNLEGCRLSLKITCGAVGPKSERKPCMIFNGNFHRDLLGEDVDDRLRDLISGIKGWSKDQAFFADAVKSCLKEKA